MDSNKNTFNISFNQQDKNNTDDQNQNQARTTKIDDPRKARFKWNPTEDSVLISAWLNTSKNPIIVGNEQKASAFWKRIASYYSSSPAVANLSNRGSSHCKQRWQKINDTVRKFVGCYDHALSQKASGQSEDDVVQVAYQFYFNNYKRNFTLEHAWRVLRNDPKWCSQSGNSTKRTKLDDGGAYSSSSNAKSNVDEQGMARHAGVKASKQRKENNVVTKTTTIEEREAYSRLKEFENMWALKEKDLAERNKLARMDLLRSLLGKTDKLSVKEETLKNKLIDEML